MAFLRASAGKVDLDPHPGMWMTGYGARIHPASGVHDPITARALLLESAGIRLAIVSCDLLGLSSETVAGIRVGIQERTGIPPDHILLSCTHTHSGPASLPMRGAMGHVDPQWLTAALDKIVEMVSGLPARLEPANLSYAAAQVTGIGFNRQDASRPIDEELLLLSLRSPDDSTIAVLANYAVHAVILGSDNLQFSADFPGALTRRLEQSLGGTALYLQGACGDANPVVEVPDGQRKSGTFDHVERTGSLLADAALAALQRSVGSATTKLAAANKMVEVPVEPLPNRAEIAEMISGFESWKADCIRHEKKEELALAQAMLDWTKELDAAALEGVHRGTVTAEVFAARIGDLFLVALPFETYSGIGLEIKQRMLPGRTLFAGYSNGLIGYCPTDWAKRQGGYGPVDSARWFRSLLTPLDYGAGQLLIREAVDLANAL